MGCDIHSFAEKLNKKTGKWEKIGDVFPLDNFDREYMKKDKGDNPFDWRNYSLFAFLADVRNYDHCEPLSKPRGIPRNVCKEIKKAFKSWIDDAHSASYFTVKELLDFDYDKRFWNRRVMKQIAPNCWDGASLAEEGEGRMITYRENLGEMFFTRLNILASLGWPGDVRVVFWFDN